MTTNNPITTLTYLNEKLEFMNSQIDHLKSEILLNTTPATTKFYNERNKLINHKELLQQLIFELTELNKLGIII